MTNAQNTEMKRYVLTAVGNFYTIYAPSLKRAYAEAARMLRGMSGALYDEDGAQVAYIAGRS